jgi:hypothetical protein
MVLPLKELNFRPYLRPALDGYYYENEALPKVLIIFINFAPTNLKHFRTWIHNLKQEGEEMLAHTDIAVVSDNRVPMQGFQAER